MRKTQILCSVLFLTLTNLLAQEYGKQMLKDMPQESIYMHLNSTLLFSGEQFQYQVFCLNNATDKLSDLSKVAHIYLVDQDNQLAFSQTLALSDGTGQGDYFVPASLPTGSYKLFCLTQWMKNGSPEEFFQADVQIINPYLPVPEQYLLVKDNQDSLPAPDHEPTVSSPVIKRLPSTHQNIKLSLNKAEVGKREPVTITFNGMEEAHKRGSYSLSVRYCPPMTTIPNSVTSFYNYFSKRADTYSAVNESEFLPELRGRLLSGRLVDKEGNSPAAGEKIALSVLGEDPFIHISTTDRNGRFYFNIDWSFGTSPGFFQILENDWHALELKLDPEIPDFGKISFADFKISEDLHEYIRQRSIQTQIENSYAEVKQDTLHPLGYPSSLSKKLPYTYNLDDYTRFNSIEETLVEIIKGVFVKSASGKRIFQVRPEEEVIDAELLPLVFVDGLFIKDHESFMDFSAKKIRSIHFSREKFLIGSEYFQGLLAFETIDGNFSGDYTSPEIYQEELSGPEPAKTYFTQKYDDTGNTLSRVPDFRNQLLWAPNLDLQKAQTVEFYTSDVAGRYEIVLTGFTATGEPVEIREYFEVF